MRYLCQRHGLGSDIKMMQLFWQHGSDPRFYLFVFGTMVGSVILGSLAVGLTQSVMSGDLAFVVFVPVISAIGAGLAIPLAFALWIVPSALIFSVCMMRFEPTFGTLKAVKWSGTITALVAALATTYVATDFGRDFDGVGSVMFYFGPAAVGLAPWVARKAYLPG